MDPLQQLQKVADSRRVTETVARKASYQAASKRRLSQIIEKKLQTAFIGALARFEDAFGHLWAHGKPEDALTQYESICRDAWSQCRLDILDNGYNQLRALKTELALYTIEWNRYVTQLNVGGQNGRQQEDVQGESGRQGPGNCGEAAGQ